LVIIYPDNEKKTFVLGKEEKAIKLDKSRWSSVAEEEITNKDATPPYKIRAISCKIGKDSVETIAACPPGQEDHATLQITENVGQKNRKFTRLALRCSS
jgi:hypothetical protein